MEKEQINYSYIIPLVFVVSTGFFYMGYLFACFNPLTYIVHKQYMHNEMYAIQNRDVFNSVISALVPIGAMIGALIGGPLAEKGRRQAIIILSILLIASSSLCLVFNFFCLFFGRLLQGIIVGCFTTVAPIYVSEIAPKSISGSLGMANQFMAATGTCIAFAIAFLAPTKDDDKTLSTNIWMVLFFLPGILGSIQLILMIFVYKYDSPSYYLNHKDYVNYNKIMKCIYKQSLIDEENLDEAEKPKITIQNSNNLSWVDLFSPLHRKALMQIIAEKCTVVGLVLSVIHQATGISCVTFYSNEIFMKGLSGAEGEKAARVGTFFIGVVGSVGSLTASYLLKTYTKKSILLFGVFGMGLCHGFLFIYSFSESAMMTKVFIILFVFLFNISIGGILWIYASEILSDKGMALVAQINFVAVLIFGCMGNIFFNILTPTGVYLSFTIIQMLSCCFIFLCMKDTAGLSKEECHTLYQTKLLKAEGIYIEMEDDKATLKSKSSH